MAFHYRITTTKTTQKGGEQVTRRATEYRQFLHPRHLGEHVAHLAAANPRSIVIHPVKAETYRKRKELGQ